LLRLQILHALGEDDLNSGNTEAGLRKFTEAYLASKAVLGRRPGQADPAFVHAQSEYFLGEASLRSGDTAAAATYWKRYRAGAGELARIEPGSVRSLMELGYSEGNLCVLAYQRPALDEALRHCTASVSYMRAAAQVRPDPARIEALANRYGWLARVQLAQGQYSAAIQSRKREAALVDALLKNDPFNAEYSMRRSWPDIGIAKALILTGRAREAVPLLRRQWARYEPKSNGERSVDFWESGLRIVFFLEKAERKAWGRSSEETRRNLNSYISRFLRTFPDEHPKVAGLREEFS